MNSLQLSLSALKKIVHLKSKKIIIIISFFCILIALKPFLNTVKKGIKLKYERKENANGSEPGA